MKHHLLKTTSLAFVTILVSAQISQACGWYAISSCSRSYDGAQEGAEQYGGYVINTDDFRDFAGGYYCSVIGPKNKEAASITAERMRDRGAYDAYIKHSC